MASPIVIVGGGTAGCTVASELAARTTGEIVLLEPGPVSPFDDHPGFLDALVRTDMTRSCEVTVSTRAGRSTYVEARALGGGSAVNGMVLSGDAPPGLEALTRLARRDELGPMGRALLASGGELARLWWNGGRWNPGRAVVHLADEGRIAVLGESVSAVSRADHGAIVQTETREIEAAAVVMCAGSIATPAILLASGLGAVNPRIGEGLQNHPVVSITCEAGTDDAGSTSPPGRFDTAVLRRDRTSAGREVLVLAYERASADESRLAVLSTILMTVESRGSVSLVGGALSVDFNVLSTDGDRAAMAEAVRGLMGLATSAPFDSLTRGFSADSLGSPVSSLARLDEDALAEWTESHVSVVSHAASSCARAVDGGGRLIGTESIWIADASVLPSVPNCTPAAPVTMEARRIAGRISEFVEREART